MKQGDPLSLSLFILLAKLLSRARNTLFEDDQFVGYGLPKRSAKLNKTLTDAQVDATVSDSILKEKIFEAIFMFISMLKNLIKTGWKLVKRMMKEQLEIYG